MPLVSAVHSITVKRRDQVEVGAVVAITKEHRFAPVAALGHMVWKARNYDTGKTGHGVALSGFKALSP